MPLEIYHHYSLEYVKYSTYIKEKFSKEWQRKRNAIFSIIHSNKIVFQRLSCKGIRNVIFHLSMTNNKKILCIVCALMNVIVWDSNMTESIQQLSPLFFTVSIFIISLHGIALTLILYDSIVGSIQRFEYLRITIRSMLYPAFLYHLEHFSFIIARLFVLFGLCIEFK